jgi:hypothetical protein
MINRIALTAVKKSLLLTLILLVKSSINPIENVGIEQKNSTTGINLNSLVVKHNAMEAIKNPIAIETPPILGTTPICIFWGPLFCVSPVMELWAS